MWNGIEMPTKFTAFSITKKDLYEYNWLNVTSVWCHCLLIKIVFTDENSAIKFLQEHKRYDAKCSLQKSGLSLGEHRRDVVSRTTKTCGSAEVGALQQQVVASRQATW